MRKLQNTLYITTQGSYLHKERETLVVEQERKKVAQLPVHSIGHIFCFGNVLVSPFLLCAMVLVAAVFALRPNNRRGGVMLLIVGGITTGFVVYFLTQLVYAFGVNGYIPVLLAVSTPALIASLVSVSVLLHLEDG